MNRSRYKERAMSLPQPAWAGRFEVGLLLVLMLLTVIMYLADTSQAFADPWSQGARGTADSSGQFALYPQEGQSPNQQNRDLYECRMWAMEETGYDPTLPPPSMRRQVRVEPMPPIGYDTAAFGFTGAILGAILGGHHSSPQGALVGGALGAMVGLVSDSARAEAAGRIQAENERRAREWESRMEERAWEYRHAMEACLENRGYGVN